MLGIVGVWPSKHGEIIKSELSNGRRKKLLPSVVEFTYDWLRFEGYLGNVGKEFLTLPQSFPNTRIVSWKYACESERRWIHRSSATPELM